MSDSEEKKVDESVEVDSDEAVVVEAEAEAEANTEAGADKKPAKKKGGLIKIIIAVVVIAAVVVVAYLTGLVEYLSLDNVGVMQDWIDGFGFLGYIIFVLLYIVAAVFMLPGSVLTIVAGLAFGPWLGAALALIGATIGATVAFIVARYVARDSIVGKFGNSPLFRKIDDGLKQNGVSFLILTRLVPAFPYNVQNYIYGLTPIKLLTYMLVSLITMAPGACIYAILAGQIAENGFTLDLMLYFAGAGIILFLVSLIPKYIAKKKGIKIKDDE